MKPHDLSDRSGTPVHGSGTARAPRYVCGACHDSGSVFNRDALGNEDGYYRRCPSCDGKSRLAGEVDDTVQTPFLRLLKNLRHGGSC